MYDSTVITTYLMCPKKFEYEWIKRIVPVTKSPALIFGAIFHDALLVWYKTKDAALAAEEFKNIPKFIGDDTRTPARARLLLDGYVKRWATEPYVIRDLEIEFHLIMANGSIFAGRMDALVDWMKGTYVKDHKTTRSLGLTFFRNFRPHFQLDGYCYACRELVGDCMGAIINGIQVCKTKIDYEKKISARTNAELDNFPINYTLIVDKMEKDIASNTFHKNLANCGMYAGCPYKDLCIYGDDKIGARYKVQKVKELESGCTMVVDDE